LQWKLQGLGTAHLGYKAIAYGACRAIGKGGGHLGSIVAHCIELGGIKRRHCGFRTTQKRRPELYAASPEGKGGSDSLSVGGAARRKDRYPHGVCDLRHQSHCAAMPAPGLTLKLPR
jgi:hypothetical protein